MKNVLLATVFMLSIITSAFADVNKVSHVILRNFKTTFHDATNVSWTTTRDYTKAVFTMDEQEMEVYYGASGEMIGSTTKIKTEQIPAVLRKKITKKMEGYKITEAIRFNCNEEDCYYVSVENDRETIILKANEFGNLTLFKKLAKK